MKYSSFKQFSIDISYHSCVSRSFVGSVTGSFISSFLSVVRECKNVELSFSDVACKTDLLRGTKKGTVYLTPYRVQPKWHGVCSCSVFTFSYIISYVVTLPTHSFVSSLIHWLSWCLFPVIPRIAWVQPCSPIIWWRAAALSSQSLGPTTLKEQCPLNLVVCGHLFLLLTWI